MRNILNKIYLYSGYLSAFFMVLIALTIIAQIMGRFVNITIDSTETAGFSLAALTFFGLSYTFQSGELAAGFLFEMDKYITEAGSLQPMGGLELVYDFSPDNSYKYIYEDQTHVSEDVIRKHTNKNLKYNIGFEMIHLNGFTFSSNFEKIMSIKKNGKSKSDRDTFIFKISRSKEEDDQFAFNYNPLNNHQSTLSYQKNVNGLDYSINHNQIFDNSLDHDTNIEVSTSF